MNAKPRKLLLVDDDALIHESVKVSLPSHWNLLALTNLAEAPRERFDAAFVDMHLIPGSDHPHGLDVIRKIAKVQPRLEIVAISGDLDRSLMENCIKAGASKFLAKPLDPEEMELILSKVEALHLLHEAALRTHDPHLAWVGQSQPSQKIRRRIAGLKNEAGPILIEGESGTGKEVVARLINFQEQDKSMLRVNVASISESLFESEFFGHIKGAFTGADQARMGIAEAADGGDLFLDEIEALSLPQQAKLLRFLESGEIFRVGSREPIQVSARVLVATNQPLTKLVQEGKFREDLLWRINGKKLTLPPLRERIDDLPALANHFLSILRPRVTKSISEDAMACLSAYNWPGNVRELKRVIEQVVLVAPLPIIRAEDVLPLLSAPKATGHRFERLDLSRGLTTLVNEFEKQIIERCIRLRPDVEEAASLLGVSRSSLYKKIKELGVDIG